ncbi:TonB-dependent receptor [Ectothiorhodospiraceae bacterium 2226]|nr:TonB-dependent receptor [Ectothiorhodospiraceae bacterium 2226]
MPMSVAAAPRLLDLSIEQLAEVQVTTASRRAEPLATSAAAAIVLTAEDIRRSGATSIPELLRDIPGLHVARIGSNRWSISARGFAGEYSNKLLVLIDGRSVYTPVHGGVNWSAQDTLLEDIERIEVIRGPGATQWGANAVNGVINIITKDARETEGGFVGLIGGTEERVAGARWGDALGERGSYRAFAKFRDADAARLAAGGSAEDDWSQGRVGARADWTTPERHRYTLQGEAYDGEVSRIFPPESPADPIPRRHDMTTRGGHLLGRWSRPQGERGDVTVQAYADWYEAHPLFTREQVATYDLDFQHHYRLDDRHDLVWGLGYRHIRDRFESTYLVDFQPTRDSTNVYSAFVQDTIALRETLSLTLGAKLEYHDYTGAEPQPSVRLAWSPAPHQTLWGAVSRASRVPSRGERDVIINLTQPGDPDEPTVARLLGSRALDAERLTAYELGYRVSPTRSLHVDATVFYHDYRELVTWRAEAPYVETDPAPPHAVLPSRLDNAMAGESYGLELATRWQASPRLGFDLAYTYFRLQLEAEPGTVATAEAAEGASPRHQLSLRPRFDLSPRLQLAGALRYVDALPGRGVPSYTTADLRINWQARPDLSLSLVGRNLLGSPHSEFDPEIEFERAGYLRLEQRF